MVLMIQKLIQLKHLHFVKYSVLVHGKSGLKYSVLGKIWYSVQP